jgi:hypothetical protein
MVSLLGTDFRAASNGGRCSQAKHLPGTQMDVPALRQHDEAVLVAAAHNLDLSTAGAGHRGSHHWPLITGFADDPLDEPSQRGSVAPPVSLAVRQVGG